MGEEHELDLDLRSLAGVDEPDVVRDALRRFRRRLWTRDLWIGVAVILALGAIVAGNRPSNLREEVEASKVRAFPDVVWRFDGFSIALEEVADLGDATGLHFVILSDPGASSPMVWVDGEVLSMGWETYDTYVKVPKHASGRFTVIYGRSCVPYCPSQREFTIDLRSLHVPDQVWRP